MLTEDLLQMLFDELGEELGMTYADWVSSSGYHTGMTDEEICHILPAGILPYLPEALMNTSWWHGGIL